MADQGDEVEAYEARHPVGTKARLALDLMLYTGLRRSDIVTIGRRHIDGDVLSIQPMKTKRTSAVFVTHPHSASARRIDRRH